MARRRTLTLSEDARRELIDSRDHDARPYVRERCGALVKIAQGKSPHWVALHGLLKKRDPDTLYSWLEIYQLEGLKGLIDRQHGGDHRRYL